MRDNRDHGALLKIREVEPFCLAVVDTDVSGWNAELAEVASKALFADKG